MDEQELIQAAKRGDLDAFNQLVLDYQDVVYNQAFYLLQDAETASDLVQDVFLKAYLNLKTFRGGSFKAWLLRTTINATYDLLRKRKRHPTVPLIPVDDDQEELESPSWLADPSPSPEELLEQESLRQALRFYLDQLQPDYRDAVMLVDLQDLDYEQAARTLDIPAGTLKSRLARGRVQLRHKLAYALSASSSRHPGSGPGIFEWSEILN